MQLHRLTSFLDDESEYVIRKSKGWVFDHQGCICFNNDRFSLGFIKNSFDLRKQEDGFLRVNGRQHTLVKDEHPDTDYALLAVAADGRIRIEEKFEFFRVFTERWGNVIIFKITKGKSFDVKIMRHDAATQTLVVKLEEDGSLDVVDISETPSAESKWKSFWKFIGRVGRDYFQSPWKGWRK